MNLEIEKFQEFYRDFKTNFDVFLDLTADFTKFFMLLDKINNNWLEYKALIHKQEIETSTFINLMLNYHNNETTHEKIREFLVQEIKINKLAELIIDNLNKFANNSRLLDVINMLVSKKHFIDNQFNLIYYLENPMVLAEINNNKYNYLLLKDKHKIIENGIKLQIFNQQLQELKDNIIYNFYLFKWHQNYDHRFANDINVLDHLLFKQDNYSKKNEKISTNILKKQNIVLKLNFYCYFF
ncbi:hypothetical protein [Spiroplasma eriocheiris]|uniref:Uncharacterized protein n=1 Tax=Spiroplasma eriocheiris TaxID=315358 RepID=A0A0H3XK23_9MOLU|nr:hypothetical protein [Spiroplasma eriocheiris]AHF57766.1 hypothetical protein SPE_0638 [Spiroplasma eriocheiris CCTCC M 207170]AKM54216.1 hypothetical protein SERIO_v1c06460 [Spiroplasma eriocheiris]